MSPPVRPTRRAGRPLGARWRNYALFGTAGQTALVVTLSASWPKHRKGPDLNMIRRLLGGIRTR